MPPWSSPPLPEVSRAGLVRLMSLRLGHEHDIVLARQRVRELAAQLEFEPQDQVRIATAVSEVAREGWQQSTCAVIEAIGDAAADRFLFQLVLTDGAWRGARPTHGLSSWEGIVAARRVLGQFQFEASADSVTFWRTLPPTSEPRTTEFFRRVADRTADARPENLLQEFQIQNQELLKALDELRENKLELEKVNRELEETNRGVVALYAELEEQAESLRRAGMEKNRLYSSISHEFRTPITSILGLSQILLSRMDGELASEQERQVSLIRRCGENLLEWVNDLLDLSRVDAGRMELRLNRFTVGGLFASLRGVMRPLCVNDHVAFVVDERPDAADVELHTDEGKLTQILRNFVSNALKFTERGEVRVSYQCASEGAEFVRFFVKDTGIGIHPVDHERVFDEFVQLDSPLQRRTKGTGLGLPLSRRLARMLGGDIQLTSTPGEGSEFVLTIRRRLEEDLPAPEAVGRPAALDADGQPANNNAQRVHLLLIDDDEASRYLVRQVLAPLHLNIAEAPDGASGLEAASRLLPAAILLDLAMPVMDGFQVAEALRENLQTVAIPVIIYSSKALESVEEARLHSLVQAIIHKPEGKSGPSYEQLHAALSVAGVIRGPVVGGAR